MQVDISRDVVSDLWPLCQSGEASRASQALVAAFLAQDAPFAASLRTSENLRGVVPPVRLSPDAELSLLRDAQQRARTKLMIIGGGVALGAVLLFASFFAVALLFFRQSP